MLNPDPITLTNALLPMVILGALAVVLPYILTPKTSRSHRRLTLVIILSGALTFLAAIVTFALLQPGNIAGALITAPLTTLLILAKPAALSAIIWIPLLALSGFTLAQRIENLRGRDMVDTKPAKETTK
jgi:hypothetical protein